MRLDQYMGTDPKLRQKPLKSPILTLFAIIFETFRKNPKKWCRLGSNPDAKQKAGKLPWRWNGTLSQNGYGTLRGIQLKECAVPTMASLEICEPTQKASSTQMASQAVPHPSTDRALRRLTSEFGRDLVYSSRYGRLQPLTCSLLRFRMSEASTMLASNSGELIFWFRHIFPFFSTFSSRQKTTPKTTDSVRKYPQNNPISRSNLPSPRMEKSSTSRVEFCKCELRFKSVDLAAQNWAFCKFFFDAFLIYQHRPNQNFPNFEGNGRPLKITRNHAELWKVSASIGSDQYRVSMCKFATFFTFQSAHTIGD